MTDIAAVRQLARRLEELSERVSGLEDRDAIRELTARYARTFDDVDTEAFAEVFTDDGEFLTASPDRAVVTKGREHLRSMSRTVGFGSVHMSLDPVIDVDGDTATQDCRIVLGSRDASRAPGSAQWVTCGRYHDELVRTPAGWRFALRDYRGDALVELPPW